jgi:uncharacterized protein (TIGR02246 family)
VFQRFTEKARRVIFFARYEACSYGSPIIEAEHLVLGMLREAPSLFVAADGTPKASVIRAIIRSRITQGQPISSSVDVPLSAECKQIIMGAAEEADGGASRTVDVAQLVMALLRLPDSSMTGLLRESGITLDGFVTSRSSADPGTGAAESLRTALGQIFKALEFMWNEQEAFGFASLFTSAGELIDVSGKAWSGADEISAAKHAFDRLAIEYVMIKMKDHSHQLIGDRFALSRVMWDLELRESGRKIGSVITSSVEENLNDEWKILLAQNTRVE